MLGLVDSDLIPSLLPFRPYQSSSVRPSYSTAETTFPAAILDNPTCTADL